ncbi:immunoglobulin domain-containing family protein [Natronococcus occultus]|uniref:Ig-like domain-containing protein n=1 Tax=Natronococcus occultus SP4 TaxID=694430 RepID=L0K274_9EURY|nr:hypothetical protein [Natronococcus occultus]AGB38655.1 hypothetical protein Natoc_2897 [Natronococcus occultus SP4]
MNRRTLLGVATGVGTATLAGCLGTLSEATESNGADDRSDRSDDHAAAESGETGDGTDGVDVIVRNDGSEPRTVDVSIRRNGEDVLDRTETIPDADVLEVTLHEAGSYEVSVETDAGRTEAAVTKPTDCEDARTEITLTDHGVESTNASVC